MSQMTNDEMTHEMMRDPELRQELRQVTSTGGDSDEALSNAWRRRFSAIRTNEFVRTCLLSLIACGPIPPLRTRRHH